MGGDRRAHETGGPRVAFGEAPLLAVSRIEVKPKPGDPALPETPAATVVETYRFTPADLAVATRRPGISAFMRIRNGAYALEAAVRSHIEHFDEIVAVHNRSTDETPEILARLAGEYGPRLRVFHYLPEVFPPGSDGHKATPADAPQSLVNYYNFALSRTRFSHTTKLDDDHVAMGAATARLVADVRAGRAAQNEMACFSGLNLARGANGQIGIVAHEPFAGNGDHWIFPVRPDTYFVKDRRFEVLRSQLRRKFHSFTYWHLKYLKPDLGFANYDLAANPHSRYARRLARLERGIALTDLETMARHAGEDRRWLDVIARWGLPVPSRDRVIAERNKAARAFMDEDLETLLAQDPQMGRFAQI
ncbi:hypothetical protein [Devosia sp.]|uniref:hypothetical protein n=1 Tax=Devosia sp. TaxID=1871048 RepID=UPI003A909F25